MKVLVWALVASFGCGSVEGDKKVDARVADSPTTDTQTIDAPISVTPAAVSAHQTDTFAAPTGTFTRVVFKTERYDDGAEYDPSTGRFTAKNTGGYLVCASLYIPSVTYELDIYKNNAREKAFAYGTGVVEGCRHVRLTAGEYIEVWLYHANGTTVTINDSPLGNWVTVSSVNLIAEAEVTGAASAASGTFTKVPLTNELSDTGGVYDAPQATFRATEAGDYLFCSSLNWGSTNYVGEIDLYVNGARDKGLGDSRAAAGGCRPVRLAMNDAVDVRMWHGMGSTVSVVESRLWTWVSVSKLTTLASVTGITTFSAPTTTFVKVPYSTEVFDDGGTFDIGTSTFTAAAAGDYLFCASMNSNPAAGSDVELDLYKNGARESAFAWGRAGMTGCRVVRLAASDQIDVRLWHNNAQQVTFATDAFWLWFTASKIR